MEHRILQAMMDPTEENISNMLKGHPSDYMCCCCLLFRLGGGNGKCEALCRKNRGYIG